MTIKSLYLSHMDQRQNTSDHILALADRCVKCGLCLPQCPTYNLTANENESPRGRIALIQGWLTGQLAPTKILTTHLDQCLLCRRCERVCPSQVSYGEIIDKSKALLSSESKRPFSLQDYITHNSIKLLLNKRISTRLINTLRLLQKTGVIFFATKSGLLKALGFQRLISYLPKLNKPIKTQGFYPAEKNSATQGNVALFTGCLSKQLDPQTVSASIKLLNRLGYGVYVPEQQVCCGALHLHEGNAKQAGKLAQTNIHTFNQQDNIVAIVSLVNGCTSQLREYSTLNTPENFTPEVRDIIEFLSQAEWPNDLKLKPLGKIVALQIPCSLQNVLRAEDNLMTLLQRIPDIKLPPESIFNQCCGAAGSYFLRFPQISNQLKNIAVDKLEQSRPELIISSNLGCALQLKAGLKQHKKGIDVIHPVLLLEQQLQPH